MANKSVLIAGATGRRFEFEWLSDLISNQNELLAIVSGPAGNGKSELTNSFARKQADENGTPCIRISGSSMFNLKYNVFQLAESLDIPNVVNNKPRDTMEIIKDFLRRMRKRSTKRILLMVDGVDDPNVHEIVHKILVLENVRSNCFVIVNGCSVHALFPSAEAAVINLDVLTEEDAIEHIKKSIEDESGNIGEMENLSELVKRYPLALQLAISFIKVQKRGNSQYKIQNYLNDFRKEISEPFISLTHIDPEFSQVLRVVTRNLSIATLKNSGGQAGKVATEILNILAYTEPSDIPFEFISRIHSEMFSKIPQEIFRAAITLLFEYSFVKGTNTAVQIHPSVQEILRLQMASGEGEMDFLRKLIAAIVQHIWTTKQNELCHLLCSWGHASKYSNLILEFSNFPHTLVILLQKHCFYWAVPEFVNENWEKLKDTLGEKHLETMKMEFQVANGLRWTEGGAESALDKYKILYTKTKSIFGDNHQVSTSAGIHMAWLLATQLARHDESFEILDKILDSLKSDSAENQAESTKVFFEDLKLVGETGDKFIDQGNYHKSLKVHEWLLGLQIKQMGEKHPDVIPTRDQIAIALLHTQEFLRAKQIFESILDQRAKLLGESHVDTRATRKNIQLCAIALEKLELLEGESPEDIVIFNDLLKNCPLATELSIRLMKVECGGSVHKIKEFLKHYLEQKVKLMDDPFNPFAKGNSEDITKEISLVTFNVSIDAIKNLGTMGKLVVELLYIMGYLAPEGTSLNLINQIYNHNAPQATQSPTQIESAMKLMSEYSFVNLNERARTFSIDPRIQQLNRLKISACDLEVDFLRNCIKSILSIEGALTRFDMPHVICLWLHASKHNLLVFEFDTFCDKICDKLQGLSMKKEMLDFAIVCREKLKEVLGESHVQTLTMGCQVGDALRVNKRFAEAVTVYTDVYRDQRRILSDFHEVTLTSGHNFALLLQQMKRWEESLELYRSVLETRKRMLGEDHPSTFITMESIAECLWCHGVVNPPHNLGDISKAKQMWEEILELKVRALGDDHPSTLNSKYNLALKLCAFNQPGRCLDLLRQVLAVRERNDGPQHPDTIKTRQAIEQVMWAGGLQ